MWVALLVEMDLFEEVYVNFLIAGEFTYILNLC